MDEGRCRQVGRSALGGYRNVQQMNRDLQAGRHVSTLEVYMCKTRVGEGADMSAGRHVGTLIKQLTILHAHLRFNKYLCYAFLNQKSRI